VDAQQGRDHLQIVLHTVVDLANQSALAVEGGGHFLLGLLDAGHGSRKGIPQLLDLGGGAKLARELQRWIPGLVPRHDALKAA
jgi:hypothetical protein